MKLKSILLVLVTYVLFSNTIDAQTARLQVIHNSPDAAAATVDIWLTAGSGMPALLIDDFQFRTASAFIDAPAGVPLQVGVAPGNSMSAADTIANFTVTLTTNETYVVVANGIVSPMGYSPAPAFGLDIYGMGREAATMGTNTDLLVCHGSTDAPTVDVVEVGAGAGTIVDNASYQDFAGYLELPTADYALQIRTGEGNTTVAQFDAPLATLSLNGAAAVVVASGFLNPAANNNGPAFGLYVALPSGGPLVQLPSAPISTARVQVIHNSADLAASTVDVWLNNTLLLDDFQFRTASPFIDAPAGTAFDVSIQPSNSTDTVNALAKFTYTLTGGEKYILVANGIVSPTGYSPVQPFDIYVKSGAKEKSTTGGNVDVLVFHGATDAPTVDVDETAVVNGNIVMGASYGDFAGYLDLAPMDYTLAVIEAAGGTTVQSYSAPLMTLGLADEAITVLASGFLTPANNSNGPAFGLWVALPAGGSLVELPLATPTSLNEAISATNMNIYPNPTTGVVNVSYELDRQMTGTAIVRDFMGRTLLSKTLGKQVPGNYDVQLDLSDLSAGTYFLEIGDDNARKLSKIIVSK